MDKTKPLVVIVDDDPSVCRAIKRLVISLGMNAETFCSGQEFLDFLEAVPTYGADCVVLDVQMPNMSGMEVQAHLARNHRGLPVIVITAHETPETRESALAAGAIAFLRKPFDEGLFARILETVLAGRAAQRREPS